MCSSDLPPRAESVTIRMASLVPARSKRPKRIVLTVQLTRIAVGSYAGKLSASCLRDPYSGCREFPNMISSQDGTDDRLDRPERLAGLAGRCSAGGAACSLLAAGAGPRSSGCASCRS